MTAMQAAIERMEANPTISVEDVALILGISEASCRTAIANGEIKHIRIGRLVRVPTEPLKMMLGRQLS